MGEKSSHGSLYKAVQMMLEEKEKEDAEHVLYPSNSKTCLQEIRVEGGSPITAEMAKKLRTLVFGSSSMIGSVETEWTNQSFGFQPYDTPMGYGLRVTKNVTKGLVMCMQGFVLKHLLFAKTKGKSSVEPKALLKASMRAQEDSLVDAIADVIWQVGDKTSATLCLTQDVAYARDNESYQCDGCTEKIHLFEFDKLDDLRFTVKRHLFEFMSNNRSGLLLFVYSLIMTRTFKRVMEDVAGVKESLIQPNGHIHPMLASFILTGRATPYLHNGIIYEGTEETMSKPKTGVLKRAEVGHLVCQRSENKFPVAVGSRLKTPTLPIWVVRSDDAYGVLFNPNRELLRDYHAENRFDLYYYSSSNNQNKSTIVTIDTRNASNNDDYNTPVLENIIHTKWNDAEVTWNGCSPYM
ncbi:inactive ubiquitin carboxyl-terminal hydrolase MINDY-4B-like [Penaeus chinensis]|uniref:inactive ubiquitin carboxyl-terminal hydrolase MINDY-4B-like n=1 Tax=Penaeus chinensis TaxID=139456 RepID=UPI001FB702D0|nr:inactive ubiquitin carboxyl-terminal hydrolase MINDY-4B-like [Penaeus chinensis]